MMILMLVMFMFVIVWIGEMVMVVEMLETLILEVGKTYQAQGVN